MNDLIIGFGPDGSPVKWPAHARDKHMTIVAPSGSGKSRHLTSLLAQMGAHREGYYLSDPGGETAYLAHCLNIELGIESTYVEITPNSSFHIDPSETDLEGVEYQWFMSAFADRLACSWADVIGLPNLREQLRRYRVLTSVIHLCCTRRLDGTKIGLHRADEMLDLIGEKAFQKHFNSVCNNMTEDRARKIWNLHTMNKRDLAQEKDSTGNILNVVLQPPVKQSLDGPGYDLTSHVLESKRLLHNAKPSILVSKESHDSITALIRSGVSSAITATNVPHTMIFDEAQAQLSHSMIEFLEQMRKDGGSVVYSFPNFKSMCNAHALKIRE